MIKAGRTLLPDGFCPTKKALAFARAKAAPQGIRTPDLLVRSQTLYPAELAAHILFSRDSAPIRRFRMGLTSLRRERDSNPRYGSPYTPLAGEHLRPLGHLSSERKRYCIKSCSACPAVLHKNRQLILQLSWLRLAKATERVGFEPTEPFGSTVFKTAAFNRSATSP